jgi:hypothetical protein
MNQNQLAELFDTSKPNISMHISNILKENELQLDSVVKNYLTTAADGKQYDVTFYSLDMILAIGFRVRSKRGTQFRIWANQHLKEYLIKGFTMDDERLKNPNGRPDYFDELLERIREIRASEKRFYQKVRDLLSLSSDYDSTDKATQMFFAETQNKLLYAVTGQTAAEIIVNRADASQPNMALTSWKGSVVRKQDIFTAKNYLSQDEVDTLNRLTVLFLDTAELRVKERKDLNLRYWRETVDGLLNFQNKIVLQEGVYGYRVTSKKNGNSIFLPAAGYRHGSNSYNVGSHGYYWSNLLYKGFPSGALYIYFISSSVHRDYRGRFYGLPVRAVCE